MKFQLKKVIPTYLAVIALSVMAGVFAGMVISGETEALMKFGILIFIGLIGFAFANVIGRVTRAYEDEKTAIRAITPLLSLMLILPVVTMAFLFGLI